MSNEEVMVVGVEEEVRDRGTNDAADIEPAV